MFFRVAKKEMSATNLHLGVLLSTHLQAILNTSHHLLNVLLQLANKSGLNNTRKNKNKCLLQFGKRIVEKECG
jgi:hypothetical protein